MMDKLAKPVLKQHQQHPQPFPATLLTLFVAFLLASLTHFAHNAQYMAYYPGMPSWLTTGHVYLIWLAQTSLGLTGLWLWRRGWAAAGSALVGIYGAMGLDGLLHYTLGLCSQHTLVANITIWSEAGLGLMLLLVCAVQAVRQMKQVAAAPSRIS